MAGPKRTKGSAGAKMAGGMRRRTAGKEKKESELDTYKRLLKGDWRGFLAKAWTDVLTMLFSIAVVTLFHPRTSAYATPFFLPSHNITTEFNITDEFNVTTGTTTEEYYVVGPNDVWFFLTYMPVWYMVMDFFREITWWLFRAVIVAKDLQLFFRHTFFHSLFLLFGAYFAVTLAADEGLLGLSKLGADYEKQAEMSITVKIFCLIQMGYWTNRALGSRLYTEVKWIPGFAEFQIVQGFALTAAYGAAYVTNFSRLAVVVASIDNFREFVHTAVATFKLAPPPKLSDKKQWSDTSQLPKHAEILKHALRVDMVTELVCRFLVLALVTVATSWDMVAIAIACVIQVVLPVVDRLKLLAAQPPAVVASGNTKAS